MKFKEIILLCTVIVLSIVLSGCAENEKLEEISKNSETIVSVIERVDESISTADILRDFILTQEGFYKKDERLLPSSVEIFHIDTTFLDGDGLEVLLDFGPLGAESPHGTLCKDGKYRAGKVKLQLTKPFTLYGAEISAFFNEEMPFYTGDGSTMHTQRGELHFSRTGENEMLMHCTDLKSSINGIEKTMRANLLITTESENGSGLIGDIVTLDGDVQLDDQQTTWTLKVLEPILKNYELECSKYLIDGVVDISETDDASTIQVFFDIDGSQSCDNEIAVEVNGKRVIHRY